MSAELRRANSLIESDPDAAYAICNDILRGDPDNAPALFIIATLHTRMDRFGEAIPMYERVTQLAPKRTEVLNNLGLCWQESHRPSKARGYFQRSLGFARTPQTMSNIGVTFMDEGNYAEAMKWSDRALAMDPQHVGATSNKGFALLATGDWSGWKLYDKCLGGKFRKELDFGAPKWNGEETESIVIYGEQGLGDEICYASMLGEVPSKQITLECDPRLETLFRRSFPQIEVYGTRRGDRSWTDGRWWHSQAAIASLPAFLRPSRESCPKTPYLVADPERRLMWRALFDSKKKPVIGLCWSGGSFATRKHSRKVGLESFRKYIETHDAYYVSLQYEDAQEEIEATGLPVRQFHELLSDDYDDTAALVAELDGIVGMHTSVHHLAGALGKRSTVLVPENPMWMYAYGDSMPWYADNRYHRQKRSESWADCINRL
jgi:hypothetical protein